MGKLSTHILDTSIGRPAAGVTLSLWRKEGEAWVVIAQAVTNSDGRTDRPLLEGDKVIAGVYELRFSVGAYFQARGLSTGAVPPFLDEVPIRFGLADPQANYHVPLLMTPWAYSTYRGS